MSNENPKYEYRFLTDDSFSVIKTIDLGAGLNQIWECLVSEGVPLHPFSVVKCMDIYLRVIGLCRGKEDEFPPVDVVFAPVRFKDVFWNDDDADEQKVEAIKQLFDLINDCIDEDRKFKPADLEVIKSGDNVKIIFKEITAFFNDIVERLVEEFSSSNTVYAGAVVNTKVGVDNGVTAHFTMDISYSSVADSIVITAQSNVLVDSNDSDPVIIAVNTFPPEIQERINKAMPETKEN